MGLNILFLINGYAKNSEEIGGHMGAEGGGLGFIGFHNI